MMTRDITVAQLSPCLSIFRQGGLGIPLETGRTWALYLWIEVNVETIPWSSYLFFRAFNDINRGPFNNRATGQQGQQPEPFRRLMFCKQSSFASNITA